MKFSEVVLAQDAEAIVLTFDMCSSSDVIEKLISRGQLIKYTVLLGKMKEHIAKEQEQRSHHKFVLYKFTGDGCILLFPVEENDGTRIDGHDLLKFMRNLSVWYRRAFTEIVEKHLDAPPVVNGITFGVDRGPLHRLTMFQRYEYIGRAIIVACRLQDAIKLKDTSPGYKALVTNSAFNEHFAPATGYRVTNARRELRNIAGGKAFHCKKIQLLPPRSTN